MSDLNTAPPQGGPNLHFPILLGAVIALVGANVYLYTQLDSVKDELAAFKQSALTEFGSLKESTSVSTQTARRSLTSLKDELETTRRQAALAVGAARTEANKHAEQLARQLAAEQARQEKVKAELQTELSQVSEAATTVAAKVGEVSTEVGTVKSEVAANKSQLETTIADLHRVTGDLGVQSGLVATNGRELEALKQLGERNYFEFNLAKTKDPQKVGDVMIKLRGADMKRNRYTIELVADDKKVEKKDKNLNEPVQFYVASKARQPYELVVNEIRKNQIVGYLSTPKVQSARK